MIAASVWITLEIEKPFGAWIWRCRAETMPLVTVRSRPKGLPIATTGSPTSISEESPRVERVQLVGGRVDLEQGDVGRRVGADDLRPCRIVVGVAELDRDLVGAFDHVVVGQHVAFGVDHEAGAGRGAAAFAVRRTGRRAEVPGPGSVGFDEGDAVAVALVDLVDDVGVAAVVGLGDRRRQRRRDGGRRAAVGLDPAGRDRDPAEDGDDGAAEERRRRTGCGGCVWALLMQGRCGGP